MLELRLLRPHEFLSDEHCLINYKSAQPFKVCIIFSFFSNFLGSEEEALKKQINELLNEGEKEPHEYIYKVIIDEWLFQ